MDASPEELVARFGWADYLVFVGMLVISSFIGLYYGCLGNKQKTTSEFFRGDGQMGIFPVAMSLAASFLSASGLMGVSVEMYRYGSMQSVTILIYMAIAPAVSELFAPMFHRLQVSSSFEYLEMRFGVPVRRLSSFILILQMTLYLATAVWVPALALNQVTGMDIYMVMTLNIAVCAFYTSVGGLKAVLWTDTFQFTLMLAAVAIVLIKGNYDVGGPAVVYEAASASGRINFFNFSVDPTERQNFWSLTIGAFIMYTSLFGINQAQIQRYTALPTMTHVRKALLLCFSMFVFLDVGNYYLGLVIYTKYKDCDPVSAGYVKTIDQLLPLFVMDTLGQYPGIPGLFVAGIYSASLSTVSTGLNALANVSLEDFIRPLWLPNLTDAQATRLSKILSLVFAVICYGVIFMMDNLVHFAEIVMSLFGLVGGPLMGVFTLGMYFPWANTKGAVCGLLTSVTLLFWIGFGAIFIRSQGQSLAYDLKPVSVAGCAFVMNETLATVSPYVTAATEVVSSEPLAIYRLSYLWYTTFGFLLVIIVGMIVSGITGFQDPRKLNPILVYDIGQQLFWYLPKRTQEYLRFNVGDDFESDDAETCKSTKGSDHFHREKKSAATKLEGIEDKLFEP